MTFKNKKPSLFIDILLAIVAFIFGAVILIVNAINNFLPPTFVTIISVLMALCAASLIVFIVFIKKLKKNEDNE